MQVFNKILEKKDFLRKLGFVTLASVFVVFLAWLYGYSPRMRDRVIYEVTFDDTAGLSAGFLKNLRKDFPVEATTSLLKQLTEEVIANRRMDYFIFGSFEKLKAHLENEKIFKAVELKRNLRGTIEIKGTVRIPIAMTYQDFQEKSGSNFWMWVDRSGVAFSPLSQDLPANILGWIDLSSFQEAGVYSGPWIQALSQIFQDRWDNVFVDVNNRVHVELEDKNSDRTVKVEFLRVLPGQNLDESQSHNKEISNLVEGQVSDLDRSMQEFERIRLTPKKIQFTSDKKMVVRTFDGS